MLIHGTANFVNFTKACDYYKSQGYDYDTPDELEQFIRTKIADGEIEIGKPDVPVGMTLILLDNGTRYGLQDET
jgi:hypothetical protein